MTADQIKRLARECGFELAGVARAEPLPDDSRRYLDWVDRGMAGAMGYLTDRRATVRTDPKRLLASARSIICVGKLYNRPEPRSTEMQDSTLGWVSRYAWGDDYHDVLRRDLEALAVKLGPDHEYKICVDTAPLLERSYAREAGLGWIGKNTCLINQQIGSWIFLGEIVTSLEIEPDFPPPDRCGACTRCIDACPTQAIAPEGYEIDARRCIPYFTIELHGAAPEEMRQGIGWHVFGCDICQDVCPWNSRAPIALEPAFEPRHFAPPLEELARLTEDEFRSTFRSSPIQRAKYAGFLRNVAIAMGNSKLEKFREPLERLAAHENPLAAEHARWALQQLGDSAGRQARETISGSDH
ncbi:MAG TPA: tRNA epoxyqueuosine(34) reductase QueG [Bryobacteraceae bacterium]|nr:tRNA epoxyqueuosine(34) reductase QueG [Bryobacteraceae bacterium]